MKIVSILAILSGLFGLACGLLNWALHFFTPNESYGEGISQPLMDFSWLGDSAFTGLAVVVLALGMAIQSFKKELHQPRKVEFQLNREFTLFVLTEWPQKHE